jgi:hypothetical protein
MATYCKQGTDAINKRKAYEDPKNIALNMNNIQLSVRLSLVRFLKNMNVGYIGQLELSLETQM